MAAEADIDSHSQPGLIEAHAMLASYFDRQIDRLMARRYVPVDPQFDPTSLAFAVRGLTVLRPEFAATAYFRVCIQTVAEGQNQDGCWPDGISTTFAPTGDIVQQPSVDIALRLGDSVFRPSTLIWTDEPDLDTICSVASRRSSARRGIWPPPTSRARRNSQAE